jgi:prepilin-type N-terminal cleavage/methylation domain-containing protein
MKRRGFTLMEVLMVMVVISILAGMLLGGITQSIHFTRRASARHECRMLATAWKQYYAQYRCWPTNLIMGAEGELAVRGAVVDVLQGTVDGDETLLALNPQRIRFMEFDRFNAAGDPVSMLDLHDGVYYARFDLDFDNRVTGPPPVTNEYARSVLVWTYNPRKAETDEEYVIGSWE